MLVNPLQDLVKFFHSNFATDLLRLSVCSLRFPSHRHLSGLRPFESDHFSQPCLVLTSVPWGGIAGK